MINRSLETFVVRVPIQLLARVQFIKCYRTGSVKVSTSDTMPFVNVFVSPMATKTRLHIPVSRTKLLLQVRPIPYCLLARERTHNAYQARHRRVPNFSHPLARPSVFVWRWCYPSYQATALR